MAHEQTSTKSTNRGEEVYTKSGELLGIFQSPAAAAEYAQTHGKEFEHGRGIGRQLQSQSPTAEVLATGQEASFPQFQREQRAAGTSDADITTMWHQLRHGGPTSVDVVPAKNQMAKSAETPAKGQGMFDLSAARAAGYSDSEIADHLGGTSKFDVQGARKAGYSDAEIIAHMGVPTAPPQTLGQKAWDIASAPMRGVARLGGKLDVAAGLKTPEEAEANVQKYGDLASRVLATGLGGKIGGSGVIGPAVARSLTQGGVDALTAPAGQQAAELLRGALAGAAGEATGGLAAKALTPLKTLRSLIPQAGPREGEKWVKEYVYGPIKGATDPKLIKDVLTNVGKRAGATATAVRGGVQSAYDQGLDQIRQFLGVQ